MSAVCVALSGIEVTAYGMSGLELNQLRLGLITDTGHEVRAAGMKRASSQVLEGTGHHAFNRIELFSLALHDIFQAWN